MCLPCKQKGRAAAEKSGLAKPEMNHRQRLIFPQSKRAVGELTWPWKYSNCAPMLLIGFEVPFPLSKAFEFTLGSNGRLQSSGTRANIHLSISTYLPWRLPHENKVLGAAVTTVRSTLLSSEREPWKMERSMLLAPFSLPLSTLWKFATANKTKQMSLGTPSEQNSC